MFDNQVYIIRGFYTVISQKQKNTWAAYCTISSTQTRSKRLFTNIYKFHWLSMVLRLHQHNIGYTADGFYRSDDPTNSVKALKEGG